jgi:hypothetical protein
MPPGILRTAQPDRVKQLNTGSIANGIDDRWNDRLKFGIDGIALVAWPPRTVSGGPGKP